MEYKAGFVSPEDVGVGAIICCVIGFGAAGLASLNAPRGTTTWKHDFLSAVLLAVVIVEYYYLGLVAMEAPSSLDFVLRECRASSKGGKMPGTFRDCMNKQQAKCTKEEPCTPCDEALPLTVLDNAPFPSECSACTFANPGLCEKEGQPPQWCSRNGTVELCNLCCLNMGTDQNGTFISSNEEVGANNCQRIYDSSQFSWDDNNLLQCSDAAFSVVTRYGCCPSSINIYDDSKIVFGDGQESPSCVYEGPNRASWAVCKEEFEIVFVKGMEVKIPMGCRLFSNGKPTGEMYCRQPTLK